MKIKLLFSLTILLDFQTQVRSSTFTNLVTFGSIRKLPDLLLVKLPNCDSQAAKQAIERGCPLRVRSKINSDFAGGYLACWRGASDEHTRSGL